MKLFNSNTPLLMVPNFGDLEVLPYNPNNKPTLPDGGCFGGLTEDLLLMIPKWEDLQFPKQDRTENPFDVWC